MFADEDPGSTYATIKAEINEVHMQNGSTAVINFAFDDFPLNEWYLFTLTCTKSGGYVTVYRDDVVIVEGQMNGVVQNPRKILRLMANNDVGSDAGMKMGDFIIYDKCLSCSSVYDIREQQKSRYGV